MSDESSLPPSAGSSDPTGSAEHGGGAFATTHWSVVGRVGASATVESAAALDRLCRQYWQPLYYFVRRRGYNEQDAQDLTQGFFARLLEKGAIEAADPQRGRFRTFLLAALQNYLANEWHRGNRQKRGGGQHFLSFEEALSAEAGYQLLPHDTAAPDRLYDRRWAQGVLQAVLARLRKEFDGDRFDVLKQFLFGDRGEVSYADAAASMGLSEAATKSAIYRLRQRYGELFTHEISQTVLHPEDVDDEIRYLLTVLETD
jgi:RNA polymerase sigma-70 factor (ECF subfamily)